MAFTLTGDTPHRYTLEQVREALETGSGKVLLIRNRDGWWMARPIPERKVIRFDDGRGWLLNVKAKQKTFVSITNSSSSHPIRIVDGK